MLDQVIDLIKQALGINKGFVVRAFIWLSRRFRAVAFQNDIKLDTAQMRVGIAQADFVPER